MLTCGECGYEARFATGEWEYREQKGTMGPPILVVECPECGELVDTRVEV